MFTKKSLFTLSLIAITLSPVLSPTLARADGAPATVDSDYTPLRVELNTDSSPIETRPYKFNAKLGGGENSVRGATGRLELSAGRKFVIGGGDANTQYGLGLNPAASLKLDVSKSAPDQGKLKSQNVEVRAGGASVFVVSTNNRPTVDMVMKADQAMGSSSPCSVTSSQCLAAVPAEVTEAAKREFKAGGIAGDEAAHVAAKQNAWLESQKLVLAAAPDPAKKPSATFAANFGSGEFMHRNQTDIGARTTGANIKGVELSTHLAFKINNLPIDLCAQAAMGAVAGSVRMLDRTEGTAAHFEGQACAGVQVGQVARLGYDYRLGVTGNGSGNIINQSHEVSARKIAGTPLMVSATYEHSRADNSSNADGSAGAARAAEGKFIKVGGEF